jgi:hypothetical protein
VGRGPGLDATGAGGASCEPVTTPLQDASSAASDIRAVRAVPVTWG